MKPAYGNRDRNERTITGFLKRRGVRFTRMQPGAGFDLLVWIAPMEAWEVKDPAQAASDRRLTSAEAAAMDYCEREGIPYYVIQTEQDALDRINAYMGR